MNCLNCNKSLPPRKRKYCSEKCSGQGWYKQSLSKLPIAKCLNCYKEFKQARNGGSNGTSIVLYCSKQCGSSHVGMVDREVRAIKRMGGAKPNRANRCLTKIINKAYTDAKHNHCRTCGAGITQESKQCCKRLCDECIVKTKRLYLSLDSTKDKNRERKRIARREGTIPQGCDRSRAKFYGVEYEPIKRKYVFDRYDWHCADCGIETPKELKGLNKPNSPELDHVIPISKGGSHTYSNVQLLCRQCNANKSDKVSSQ